MEMPCAAERTLSVGAALELLPDMPGTAAKIYLYLCGRYCGRPVEAAIPKIAEAVGIKRRSVISALKWLREKGLVASVVPRGSRPNLYTPKLAALGKSIPSSEPSIDDLIEARYRRLSYEESARLRTGFPDQRLLRTKLLQMEGGVADEMPLGFFIAALEGSSA